MTEKKTKQIRIEGEAHKILKIESMLSGRTMSDLASEILKENFKEHLDYEISRKKVS